MRADALASSWRVWSFNASAESPLLKSHKGLNSTGSSSVTAVAPAETMMLSKWWQSKRLVASSRKDRGRARWSGNEALKISLSRISTLKTTQGIPMRSHAVTALGSMPQFFKTMRGWWCQKCRNYGNTKVVTRAMKAQETSSVIQILGSSMKRENKLKSQSHSPRSLQGWRRPTRRPRSWRTMRSSKARTLMSRFIITCIIRKT